jgi:hypothetical protein
MPKAPNQKPADVLRARDHDARFYAQVGACVEVWSNVDRYLLRTCRALLGTSETIASIVYYRTPTVESRMALIADLAEARFPVRSGAHQVETVKKLERITKEIRNHISFRNSVAHGARVQVTHAMLDGSRPPTPGFHSEIVQTDPRRTTRIGGEELDRHHDDVFRIARRLLDLCVELDALLMRPS